MCLFQGSPSQTLDFQTILWGRLCLLPPVQHSLLCSLTAAIWCLDAGTRIILSPKDNDIKGSSLQFSSFARNRSAWTLYQLGLFQLAQGEQPQICSLKVSAPEALTPFPSSSHRKTYYGWKSMILKYANLENFKKEVAIWMAEQLFPVLNFSIMFGVFCETCQVFLPCTR